MLATVKDDIVDDLFLVFFPEEWESGDEVL